MSMSDKPQTLRDLIELMRRDRELRDLIRCGFYASPTPVSAFNPWRFAAVFERLTGDSKSKSFEVWARKYGFLA